MTLAEYEKLADAAEKATASEGLFIMAGLLRTQIDNALWNTHCQAKARELVRRLRAIEDRSAVAADCASPDWTPNT